MDRRATLPVGARVQWRDPADYVNMTILLGWLASLPVAAISLAVIIRNRQGFRPGGCVRSAFGLLYLERRMLRAWS
jgi:hypothetical protein